MNKKNDYENKSKLLRIKMFFKWFSKFTLTLIDDIWTRRIIAGAFFLICMLFLVLFLMKVPAFVHAITFTSIQF